MSNNPLDFVSGIIRQYSLRLRRIIVKYKDMKRTSVLLLIVSDKGPRFKEEDQSNLLRQLIIT